MNVAAEFLSWDTAFFGVRIGRLTRQRMDAPYLAEVLAWAQTEQIACLYFLADPDDPPTVRLAEDAGFRFMDIRSTLEIARLNPPALPMLSEGVHLRMGQASDFEPLRYVARDSYTQTRFFSDPRFSHAQCADLYETWLRRSLLEQWADGVVVAEVDGVPMGYVTGHLDAQHQRARIGLVGVHEATRGRSVGAAMLAKTLQWFHEAGMTSVEVTTQARNIPAQRLYQRAGFIAQSVGLWYHLWLS